MCDSTYTIDRVTGEKLECDKDEHMPGFPDDNYTTHAAWYLAVRWTWRTNEEDKHG